MLYGFLMMLGFVFSPSESNWVNHQVQVPDTLLIKDKTPWVSPSKDIYLTLGDSLLDFEVFDRAYKGYLILKEKDEINKEILSIIDYNLSSTKKRLWVIDIREQKILFNELVAHGINSGNEFAMDFSNVPESYKSSLGFFTTRKTYIGKHGLSLYLDGVEQGINDNARKRYIVMHGADYVSESFINTYGRLGRSHGCPALSKHVCKTIVETIANNSCIFIDGNSQDYRATSTILMAVGEI